MQNATGPAAVSGLIPAFVLFVPRPPTFGGNGSACGKKNPQHSRGNPPDINPQGPPSLHRSIPSGGVTAGWPEYPPKTEGWRSKERPGQEAVCNPLIL